MEPPQVSPELAAKVLAASTRNAIKGVGEGGSLPAAQRKEMEGALTPELAIQRRSAALLAKFCAGGDLSPAQWEEIRQSHPGFAEQPAPPSTESFALAIEPDRSVKLTKDAEARYEKLYGKKWRQIRRWIDRGVEQGDPCPLHDPVAMPAWWSRNMKWRVPAEIEQAAVDANKSPQESPKNIPESEADSPQIPPSAPLGKPIDLESIDPEEGDRLRELKQIQSAKFTQLREALKRGEDCTAMESKYLKLCETIDKIETRVTERLKKRGLFIMRDQVEKDLAAGAELLRHTRVSMVRRVLELCSSLNPEQRAEVSAAIERARASEERLLCKLDSLKSDDLLLDFSS